METLLRHAKRPLSDVCERHLNTMLVWINVKFRSEIALIIAPLGGACNPRNLSLGIDFSHSLGARPHWWSAEKYPRNLTRFVPA